MDDSIAYQTVVALNVIHLSGKETAFRENIVIITGASFGIGRQLAFQLADFGAWLAQAARNEEKLEEVSKQCSRRGDRAIVIPK
jgi:short-subunit dehydrogenase